jgi:hypothetical protein
MEHPSFVLMVLVVIVMVVAFLMVSKVRGG